MRSQISLKFLKGGLQPHQPSPWIRLWTDEQILLHWWGNPTSAAVTWMPYVLVGKGVWRVGPRSGGGGGGGVRTCPV